MNNLLRISRISLQLRSCCQGFTPSGVNSALPKFSNSALPMFSNSALSKLYNSTARGERLATITPEERPPHETTKHDLKEYLMARYPFLPQDMLANLSDLDAKKLLIYLQEYEYIQATSTMPIVAAKDCPYMQDERRWREILHKFSPSASSRKKLIQELQRQSHRKEGQKLKKQQQRNTLREEEDDEEETERSEKRGRKHVLIFKGDERRCQVANLVHAQRHGPDLVISCGFHDQMARPQKPRALTDLVKSLKYAYTWNRNHQRPFNLILTDVKPGGKVEAALEEWWPQLPDLFVTVTSRSYRDLFPKKDLCILSADVPFHPLDAKWDERRVYVIGGISDRVDAEEPLTLAEAKQHGIAVRSLPVSHYAKVPAFKNELGAFKVQVVVGVLLDVRLNGDWQGALLKYVPSMEPVDAPLTHRGRSYLSDPLSGS